MPSGRRVGLFVTCLVDMMRPRIGFAALKLLEGAGFEVVVPATQTCCGQPGWNSGERASARALAEKLIGEFEHCDYLVAPSGSCAGMIKTHYPALFPGEGAWLARVEALGAKSWELTDFLVNVAHFELPPGRFSGTITYHDSCAGLRELGVKQQPRRLLASVDGLALARSAAADLEDGAGGGDRAASPASDASSAGGVRNRPRRRSASAGPSGAAKGSSIAAVRERSVPSANSLSQPTLTVSAGVPAGSPIGSPLRRPRSIAASRPSARIDACTRSGRRPRSTSRP